MSDQVFDEEISLKRFGVALKRADWRMFEQALTRLDEEILAGSPFSRHQAWQDYLRTAEEREDLPEGLATSFREALGRLLSVEARVTPGAEPTADDGVAIVAAWSSGLADARVRAEFARWLGEPGADPARQLLSRWLAQGVDLSTLAHRANLSLAAGAAGLALADAPWVELFYAGLARALATAGKPPLARLNEALAGQRASVLLAEPGRAWESLYADLDLIKLGGSLDLFACARCHASVQAGGPLQPLAVACPGCGAPAWPLVVPMDQPSWQPPAARALRERAAESLKKAGTWVLVEPPAPQDDALAAWLVGCAPAGKRVLVVGAAAPVLEAWQLYLAPFAPRAVVTSRGPTDDVLAFLLQGGVPELEPAGPQPGAFSPRKKVRR